MKAEEKKQRKLEIDIIVKEIEFISEQIRLLQSQPLENHPLAPSIRAGKIAQLLIKAHNLAAKGYYIQTAPEPNFAKGGIINKVSFPKAD